MKYILYYQLKKILSCCGRGVLLTIYDWIKNEQKFEKVNYYIF